MTFVRAPWPVLVGLLLVAAALGLRVGAASRPGLWADEIFSLAMATGHSLEHPPAAADTTLGDFVQPSEARHPQSFRRYAEHDQRPAGAARVVRAVLLSDTSPPLYYLLLNGWTRAFGSGDLALRLFSVWWAVLCLPLLWLLGRELGGLRAAWSACLLFAFSPVALYYSAEGRMYSLLWALALALGWLTLRLAGGGRSWQAALWVAIGAAGLLTHYFFAFVWLACVAWLGLAVRPALRWRIAGLAALALLAALPWYVQVPASLSRWRVSAGWLDGELLWRHALCRPFALAGSLVSGNSYLGGWRRADRLVGGLGLLVVLWIALRGSLRSILARGPLLLWGWMAAACTGPVVFDLLRHTTASDVPRYALAGLPAAILLAAIALSQLPPAAHLTVATAVVLAWTPGVWATAAAKASRPWEPYPELAARLESWARPGDLLVVRSIPSGVVGVARYLERDVPVAPWVSQLGTREVPADLERLLRGRRRVAVATIHDAGATDSVRTWLQAHARLLGHEAFRSSTAEVWYFDSWAGDRALAGVPR
jgi:hypothetical protein